MRKFILALTILLLVPLASAQFLTTHPSLNITNYKTILEQSPGTTDAYMVNVTNTGDVPLEKVYLTLSFLPSSWYKTGDSQALDVGETKGFNYTISVPQDAKGSLDLDLTAHAVRGFGEVAQTTVKIFLVAGNNQSQTVQSTTSASTSASANTPTAIIQSEGDFMSNNATLIAAVLIVFIAVALLILFKD